MSRYVVLDGRTRVRGRKNQLHRRRDRDVDALLGGGVTRFPAWNRTRAWLARQDPRVQREAAALLARVADIAPEALVCRSHKREIGACPVARFAFHHERKVRDMRAWVPCEAHGIGRVAHLAQHLFAIYPAPRYALASLIQPPSTLAVDGDEGAPPPLLYPHVAQGGRFVDAGLPVAVTGSLAHQLSTTSLRAPRLAIRSAQLAAARVDGRIGGVLAQLLAHTPFTTAPGEALLARFFTFAAHNDLVERDVAHICRLVMRKARVDTDFSFVGRTSASLLAIAQREMPWFRTDRRLIGALPSSGLRGGRFVVDDDTAWVVREILSGFALQQEGARLRHCVATYARKAAHRKCALFSIVPDALARVGDDATSTAGVTIEVSLARRVVVQIKGFANRGPNAIELAVVRAWSRATGIAMPRA